MQCPNILPTFLQQWDQEVDTHIDILSDLFRSMFNSGNSGSHTEDFLKLESNSSFDFVDFVSDFFRIGDLNWELTHLDQDVS